MKLSFASITLVTLQIASSVIVKGLVYSVRLASVLVPMLISLIVFLKNQNAQNARLQMTIQTVEALKPTDYCILTQVLDTREDEPEDLWANETEASVSRLPQPMPMVEAPVIRLLPPAPLTNHDEIEPAINFADLTIKQLRRYCSDKGIVPDGNKAKRETWLKAAIAS